MVSRVVFILEGGGHSSCISSSDIYICMYLGILHYFLLVNSQFLLTVLGAIKDC